MSAHKSSLISRFSRFSLRTLLTFMVLVCVLLGIWTVYVRPYQDQKQAWDQLVAVGGQVHVEVARGTEWQKWLVETMVSDDAFVEVLGVDLRKSQADDSTLEVVRFLPELQDLTADGVPLTRQGLEALRGCPDLRTLSLRFTSFTDADLDVVCDLKRLETLQLTGTELSDRGLARLGTAKTLKEVYARWTQASAQGVAALERALPGCKVHFQSASRQGTKAS